MHPCHAQRAAPQPTPVSSPVSGSGSDARMSPRQYWVTTKGLGAPRTQYSDARHSTKFNNNRHHTGHYKNQFYGCLEDKIPPCTRRL